MKTWALTRSKTSLIGRNSKVQIPTLLVSVSLTLGALILWLVSLPKADVNQMSDIGLASILSANAIFALLLLTISWVLALSQRQLNPWLLFFNVVALVFMLYGASALVEEMPRFAVTWRHIGVIDLIQDSGKIDPHIDAYFNWPGFFVLNTFMADSAGLHSAVSLGAWVAVFLNLLYFGPLMMIFTAATDNKHIAWLAIWVFYLGNWIGQDYFSPQGFNYFLYLVILAILVKWFKTTSAEEKKLADFRWSPVRRIQEFINTWLTRPENPNAPSNPAQRAGLVLILITIFIAITVSHQLTPYPLLFGATALVLFKRISLRGLPLIFLVVLTVVLCYMASIYMRGHLTNLVEEFGQVNSGVSSGVSQRVEGSPGHIWVVRIRLLTSLAVWGLAFCGAAYRFGRGYGDATWGILAIIPFGLFGVQDYGGEMLLRIYLFNLPFMAFFIAALLTDFPVIHRLGLTSLLVIVVCMGLTGGFFLSRYGNEKMDYKTPEEIEGVQYLYDTAPADSLWLAITPNLLWKFQDYDKYHYQVVTDEFLSHDIDGIVSLMKSSRYTNAYLLITRSQRVNVKLTYNIPASEWDQFEQSLLQSNEIRLVFSNRDVQIFGLANNVGSEEPVAHPSKKHEFPIRSIAILTFLSVVPGWVLVRQLRLKNPLDTLMLAIALSFALETILALGMIYTEVWEPHWMLVGLMGMSLFVLSLEWIKSRRDSHVLQ
jgi:hypothetical protein